MAYTSESLIEQYLQRQLTASEVSFLATLIPAIKIWIDKKTDSTFDQATETTRYFDGGGNSVDIDPATAITAVKAVDYERDDEYAYTDETEYIAEPQNETVKRELLRRGSSRWPRGSGNIAVTAKFSEYDGGVPEDIQLVATRLASEIINSGKVESSGGNVDSESLEGHTIKYDTSVSTMDMVADNDPFIKGVLEQRREFLVG